MGKKAICLCMAVMMAAMILAGCSQEKWEIESNTVTGNTIYFYNGISATLPGEMTVGADNEESEFEKQKVYASTYMSMDEASEVVYIVMQMSSQDAFKDIVSKNLTDEEFVNELRTLTGAMESQIKQGDPLATLTGPDIVREKTKLSKGGDCENAFLEYAVEGTQLNATMLARIIMTNHDLIAVFAMGDDGPVEDFGRTVLEDIML